ncbi:MAG: LysR family transcriptional regulator ArgP [Kangiellaceae bacterium]
MNQIDYKLLRALNAVIQCQSFEGAASKLCISQSAVSQRVKQLEEFVGHPVLIRGRPITLTPIGSQLVGHFKQVDQLERELVPKILPESPLQPIKLSISVNADSLAIWFIEALAPLIKFNPIELDIIVSDESRTTDKLKSGEAYGAISTMEHPLPGYRCDYLGDLKYVLVASKGFQARYFANGVNHESLKLAPGVAYDQLDNMHLKFIHDNFGLPPGSYPCHTVRSSEAFVELAKKGLAYTLIPKQQIEKELKKKELVNLLPGKSLSNKLYWHSWLMGKGVFKKASELIINYARNYLPYE